MKKVEIDSMTADRITVVNMKRHAKWLKQDIKELKAKHKNASMTAYDQNNLIDSEMYLRSFTKVLHYFGEQ